MKNILFTLLFFGQLTANVYCQTDVTFNIFHNLGDNPFELNATSSNNLGHEFNVTRLQYYISEISIIHDNDQETVIEDLHVLVNATETTNVSLGNYPITDVEKIKFHVGVDEASNHVNPVSYWPEGHPLYPTSPSMHWGWTAGYRFLAFEGNSGIALEQIFEFHALGDVNYFTTEVEINSTANNGSLAINLDADYTRGLEGIELENGVIVHGEDGDAKIALENFRDYVFSPSTNVVSNIDFSEINDFNIFPNPSENGLVNIKINSTKDLSYELSIVNIIGQEIEHIYEFKSNNDQEIEINKKGIYFVNIIKEGVVVLNKKLVIK